MQDPTKRKPPYLTLLLIIFGIICTVLSGYIVNSIDINPAFKPFAFPALIIIICILCIIALCQYFLQQNPQVTIAKIRSQNRQHLLAKVRNVWIQGFLEHSLNGAVLIVLGLQERQDLIADPWHLRLQQPDSEPCLLAPHTRITQAYDDAGGELLILGAPGSGKTTLLLELTRDLLDRANKDKTFPIPLVLNLSSWTLKRKLFSDWLVEEMNIRYQIPRKLGQDLIKMDQVLLLLDGLDEVAHLHREACVNVINTYRGEHGLSSMVVCSRTGDYELLSSRLNLQRAVVIQPLTDAQIDEYIANAQGQLYALRKALQEDSSLRELATMPLMLSILTLAYHGQQKDVLVKSGSAEMRREQIFREYVNRMLQHSSSDSNHEEEQKIIWLSWLAWQLKEHSLSDFYLERMQPDWLPVGNLRNLHPRFVGGLVCSVTSGLITAGSFLGIGFSDHALTFGVLIGLLGMFIGILNIRTSIVYSVGVLIGASIGAYYGPHSIQHSLLGGILYGIVGGVVFASFILALTNGARAEIQPAEILVWSWIQVQKNWMYILFIPVIFGIIAGIVNGLGSLYSSYNAPDVFLLTMILSSINLLLLSLLYYGFSNQLIDNRSKIMPNQGIWRTAKLSVVWLIPALLLACLGTILAKLIQYGLDFLLDNLVQFLIAAVFVGISSGLYFWLLRGGMAFVQHFILRVLLWYTKSIPWNYVRFLDDAARHILLYKVGGGYIFIHRQLQEYFASLYTSQ